MAKTTKVECDGCGHDLTTRSNCVDYRLVLCAESKPGRGSGFYTSMMIYPPVERDYYFCDLGCLDQWRSHQNHKNALWQKFMNKWKEEKGERCGNGISYPDLPPESRAACKAEFEAAAHAVFPLNKKAGK
jgi:hypothetical protein